MTLDGAKVKIVRRYILPAMENCVIDYSGAEQGRAA
jgi:hypothetical protein